jgi:CheY-like chemotaxis protein
LLPADVTSLVRHVNNEAVKVLCVDDNPRVLLALKAALIGGGFAVETLTSGWEALRRLRDRPREFRVVVTDIRMPELTGVKMIRQSRAFGYAGPFVVCAAGVFDADRAALIELGVQHIIEKTAGVAPLIDAVQQAAAGYTPAAPEPITPPRQAPQVVDDEWAHDDGADGEGEDDESGQRYHSPSAKPKRDR